MRTARSLRSRAITTIFLMVGFYVLALSVAALLLYLPYTMYVHLGRVNARLALFCIVGAGIVLWSIVPRPDRFIAPGPSLNETEQPRLFQQLKELAAVTGQSPPTEVYLTPDVNAWVAERGGSMGVGSRRVMGLGLPLMQLLDVSQLRAVLAHEFGHFYGGDTKLGPWIYKTRGAMGRTIETLQQHSELLNRPFLWYGNMFLRITHAISQQQEYTADELASRTVSPRALESALIAIHGPAELLDAYYGSEVQPLLNAGFRPRLAEGFLRFTRSSVIAPMISEIRKEALADAAVKPLDTHPPLRERIAALRKLPAGTEPQDSAPAITLLDALEDLERKLLVATTAADNISDMPAVSWDEIGEQVYLPAWRKIVTENLQALNGVTPAVLPTSGRGLEDFGLKLVPKGEARPRDELARMGTDLVGAALAVALHECGWQFSAEPGEPFTFRNGDLTMAPFDTVRKLGSGEIKADDWRSECARAGIASCNLGAPASSRQTG